jgi:hypothetical protein
LHQQPISQASHAHHAKAKIIELEDSPEKEKVVAESKSKSSHSVTSHVQGNDQKYAKAGSSVGRNERDESSHGKRGATSHNKYGFS